MKEEKEEMFDELLIKSQTEIVFKVIEKFELERTRKTVIRVRKEIKSEIEDIFTTKIYRKLGNV